MITTLGGQGMLQILKFLIAGATNTAFSYMVYAVALTCGAHYATAYLLGLTLGIPFGFLTQGKLVFGNASAGRFLRFVALWVGLYFFNVGCIRAFLALGFDAYLAGLLAIPPTTILSFLLQKFVVFAPAAPTTTTP